MAASPRSTLCAHERLSFEQRARIIVRKNGKIMARAGTEPVSKFFVVLKRGIVGVGAVEKSDADYFSRKLFHRIQVAENKTAAATVAA